MKPQVRFMGDMVVIVGDPVVMIVPRAQFAAALQAEQRRRRRQVREARVPPVRRGGE